MAKIPSKFQKLFGATGPSGILGQFGSLKAGTPRYSIDTETIQALAAYGQGLDGAMINNAPPAIQDINAMFYLISRQIAYFMQTGIAEWSATTTYYIGSVINDELGNLYTSVTDNNLNNPISDHANWLNIKSNFSRDVVGDPILINSDYCYVWASGTTGPSGTGLSFLPTASESMRGRKIIVVNLNEIEGSGFLSFSATLLCTGTKWVSVNAGITLA